METVPGYGGFYLDNYGLLRRKYLQSARSAVPDNISEHKECAVWLRFIVIFWSPRVLLAAIKFGVAAMVMNRYERLGFAILMLCFALGNSIDINVFICSVAINVKMPGGYRCAIGICKNQSKTGSILFFRFLKNNKIRKEWIRRCYRDDEFNPCTSRICQVHFSDSDFEENLRAELLNNIPKKLQLNVGFHQRAYRYLRIKEVQ